MLRCLVPAAAMLATALAQAQTVVPGYQAAAAIAGDYQRCWQQQAEGHDIFVLQTLMALWTWDATLLRELQARCGEDVLDAVPNRLLFVAVRHVVACYRSSGAPALPAWSEATREAQSVELDQCVPLLPVGGRSLVAGWSDRPPTERQR